MAAKSSDGDDGTTQDRRLSITLPLVGIRLTMPPPDHLAWYVGLGAMAVVELIEWPVALVIAAGHAIAQDTHHPTVANLAEGAESGA